MDAFTLTLGLTLAVAGLFLFRDYAQFLRSSYAMAGRVVSIQQVFVSQFETIQGKAPKGVVENGFYPVIEYDSKDGPVSFTSIDKNTSGRFHVGDDIKLRICKKWRSENRICKTVIVLVSMLTVLCLDLTAAAFLSEISLSIGQIYLASFVIAICLAILVLYARDHDECGIQPSSERERSHSLVRLCEPAALNKWAFSGRDPVQTFKIRNSQVFGATCMCSAVAMLVVALQPIAIILL